MDIVKLLYFAICFSITGAGTFLLCVYNAVGGLKRGSIARLSRRGVINWLWFALFLPFGVVFSALGVLFWIGVFRG